MATKDQDKLKDCAEEAVVIFSSMIVTRSGNNNKNVKRVTDPKIVEIYLMNVSMAKCERNSNNYDFIFKL